jgi:VIT1/CCC1 family predicted Fe2+/Mn2+ transporter
LTETFPGRTIMLGRDRIGPIRRRPGRGDVTSDLTRAVLGTRARLLTVVAVVFLLVVVIPIVLLVLGFPVLAAVSVVVGLLGLAGTVMALLPGRRRWR